MSVRAFLCTVYIAEHDMKWGLQKSVSAVIHYYLLAGCSMVEDEDSEWEFDVKSSVESSILMRTSWNMISDESSMDIKSSVIQSEDEDWN